MSLCKKLLLFKEKIGCVLFHTFFLDFSFRISMMDQEKKHLLEEVSELQSKHQVELDYIRRKHEQKMEDVHGKVKLALEKKEENLMIVKGQYESALKRVDHLQLLLQRQRTELINKT